MAWFDAYLDALNAHDIPAVLEFMSDDVVYTDMAVGERMEGRAATGEFLGRMATNVSTDYRFDNEQVLIDGESFALVWTMSGTKDRGETKRLGFPPPDATSGSPVSRSAGCATARSSSSATTGTWPASSCG